MIETNETGQRQVMELVKAIDSHDWTDWERDFIEDLIGRSYKTLTTKQKSVITNLYDKLRN